MMSDTPPSSKISSSNDNKESSTSTEPDDRKEFICNMCCAHNTSDSCDICVAIAKAMTDEYSNIPTTRRVYEAIKAAETRKAAARDSSAPIDPNVERDPIREKCNASTCGLSGLSGVFDVIKKSNLFESSNAIRTAKAAMDSKENKESSAPIDPHCECGAKICSIRILLKDNKCQAAKDSDDSENTSEAVEADDTSEAVEADDTSEAVEADDTSEAVEADDTSEAVEADDTSEAVEADDTDTSEDTSEADDDEKLKRWFQKNSSAALMVPCEFIKAIIDSLFEHQRITKYGLHAKVLKDIIIKLSKGEVYLPEVTECSQFTSDLEASPFGDEQARQFVAVWEKTEFDSTVLWHKTVKNCAIKYEASLPFKILSRDLFNEGSVMDKFQKILSNLYSELDEMTVDALYLKATISTRAKLPFVTDMLEIFGQIAYYLKLISTKE